MGSRAVVMVCRDGASPPFGIEGAGAVWTRTGRAFFPPALTATLLERLRSAADKAGLFDELDASWLLMDAELLPWSAKAGELLRDQYAAVGAAARASLPVAVDALSRAADRGVDVGTLLSRTQSRVDNAGRFEQVYRRYCWQTDGLEGVQLAPFQLLATSAGTYWDGPHAWHLDVADRLVAADDTLIAPTRRVSVDAADPSSVAEGVRWWEDLTAAGGEGMVVKPAANLVRTANMGPPIEPRVEISVLDKCESCRSVVAFGDIRIKKNLTGWHRFAAERDFARKLVARRT